MEHKFNDGVDAPNRIAVACSAGKFGFALLVICHQCMCLDLELGKF